MATQIIPAAVEVENLTHYYGDFQALDTVSITVPSGKVTSVLGQSGSGKTTLLRCVAGLERPHSGSIKIDNETVVGDRRYVAAQNRNIGLVPQEGALFPHLTVAQNIGYGVRRVTEKHRKALVSELLDLVGLDGLARRYPHELSGGQAQRVAIARALAVRPKLVLLDEPFSALDTGLRERVRTECIDLVKQYGASVLVVTHDYEEALAISDYLVILEAGQVVQAGKPETVYRHPVSEVAARAVGYVNVVPGDIATTERDSGISKADRETRVAGLTADTGKGARRSARLEFRSELGVNEICECGYSLPENAVRNIPQSVLIDAVWRNNDNDSDTKISSVFALIRPTDLVFDQQRGASFTINNVEYRGNTYSCYGQSASGLELRIDTPMKPESRQLKIRAKQMVHCIASSD